jgi:hypothetical protein
LDSRIAAGGQVQELRLQSVAVSTEGAAARRPFSLERLLV